MAAATNKMLAADNGYFEQWERPCGHRFRVQTEQFGYRIHQLGDRALLRRLRAEAADRPCVKCRIDAAVAEVTA
jgi:hypothetical protein